MKGISDLMESRAALLQQQQHQHGQQTQSQYSLLPFPAADIPRYKKQLQDCIKERCLDEELADAYESLGLGQLFLGNYVEVTYVT